MKKLLLVVMALSFFATSFAQLRQMSPKKWYNSVTVQDRAPQTDPQSFTSEINTTVNNSRQADIVVGETWYDLQSNSSMCNRIYAYEDGTIGATWTRGMTPTAYADRGTGYNYNNGSAWGAYPTERIEDQKTGWPNYAPYGANGEIVCAHSVNDGLYFSWRENKGEGDWNYFNLVGPAGHEDILWPRMITSGENHEIIHVICVTPGTGNQGTVYEGLDGALLYSRSSDGGQTWDPQNVILEGVNSDYTSGWGGDDYAFAAPQGNTLAFFAFGGIRDGVIMKSTDGGDNWERMLVYESPMPFFTGNEGTLPKCGGGDGYNAIAIDDEGLVHAAFGRQVHMDDTPDDAKWSYYPYSDGLVYWREGMPALDTADILADIIPEDWETTSLYQNGNLAAWVQPSGEDTIVGLPYYGASMTTMPQIVTMRDENDVKIVQVIYSAISVGFDNSELNFHHIWGRFTEVDDNWSEFTDYTGDVFHIFSECAYPSVAPKAVGGKIHVLYQNDNMPGTSIQPDPPEHDPVLNTMVYLPISPLPVNVEENPAQSLEISQNYPNPFNGTTYVSVDMNESANLSLEVYTLTGQKVAMNDYGFKTAGSHTITIDGSQLTTGIYFYTITAGESKVTRKMMVD